MLAVFLLIGWIDGDQSGGVVNIEFNSLESCERVKAMYQEMHKISKKEDRYSFDSWVECVKK